MHSTVRQRLGKILSEVIIEMRSGIKAFDKIGFNPNKSNAIVSFILMNQRKLAEGYQVIAPGIANEPQLKDSMIKIIQNLDAEANLYKRKAITKYDFQDSLKVLKKAELELNNIGARYIGKGWLA